MLGKPVLPIPTEEQVQWLEREIVGFIHFGVNTYTGRWIGGVMSVDMEWGLGNEDPNIFNPVKLNTTQVGVLSVSLCVVGGSFPVLWSE